MKNAISTIISVMLALIFAVSAFKILQYVGEQKNATDSYSDLMDYVVIDSTGATQMTEPEETQSPETVPATEPVKKERPITIDFNQLKEQYPDTVGWLYCEDTPINYPVMQSDDNDYYLRRLPDGTRNTAGSLFADYRCGEVGETNNYIIYGHNMRNGTMFRSLVKYKKQSFYEEHPVMYFFTPDADYEIKLIAGVLCKSNWLVYNTYQTLDQMLLLCEESTFQANVSPEEGDAYITLSTCSYEYKNARYVVIGIMEKM